MPRAPLGLAIVLMGALACGESYTLIGQLDRIVSLRDAQASTISASNEAQTRAADRLNRALATQADQSNAARSTVTAAECKMQCRALLESQAGGTGWSFS